MISSAPLHREDAGSPGLQYPMEFGKYSRMFEYLGANKSIERIVIKRDVTPFKGSDIRVGIIKL